MSLHFSIPMIGPLVPRLVKFSQADFNATLFAQFNGVWVRVAEAFAGSLTSSSTGWDGLLFGTTVPYNFAIEWGFRNGGFGFTDGPTPSGGGTGGNAFTFILPVGNAGHCELRIN
jgi:hypothetical protein